MQVIQRRIGSFLILVYPYMKLKALDIIHDGQMSNIVIRRELDTNLIQYSRIHKNYNDDG